MPAFCEYGGHLSKIHPPHYLNLKKKKKNPCFIDRNIWIHAHLEFKAQSIYVCKSYLNLSKIVLLYLSPNTPRYLSSCVFLGTISHSSDLCANHLISLNQISKGSSAICYSWAERINVSSQKYKQALPKGTPFIINQTKTKLWSIMAIQ